MEIETATAPLAQPRAGALAGLWTAVFGGSLAEFQPVLGGTECQHNRSTVFCARQGDRLIGACYSTASRAVRCLGGLGGVGVLPEFRRRGIATALCEAARDQFRARGGQALFLGTNNPAAATIYRRLGWRKLAGANVWVNLTCEGSPKGFLSSYFAREAASTVRPGGPWGRIAIIPLLVTPHRWHVLDSNAAMLSTRYAVQASCMGLYPKYEAISAGGKGAWFAGSLADGRIVGLATVSMQAPEAAVVDGFTHWRHALVWHHLIQEALAWAWNHGAQRACAYLCGDHAEKQALFARIGFRDVHRPAELELAGTRVPCLEMEKRAGT